MLLADSNVWLAIALDKHEFHPAARAWMDEQTARRSVHFCRATQQSVIRLLTTGAVLAPYGRLPLTNRDAWALYEAFRNDDRIAWAEEPLELESNWKRLAAVKTASPKLWMDAYLAGFAMAGGYKLVTTDTAFEHFKGLDVRVITSSRSNFSSER